MITSIIQYLRNGIKLSFSWLGNQDSYLAGSIEVIVGRAIGYKGRRSEVFPVWLWILFTAMKSNLYRCGRETMRAFAY